MPCSQISIVTTPAGTFPAAASEDTSRQRKTNARRAMGWEAGNEGEVAGDFTLMRIPLSCMRRRGLELWRTSGWADGPWGLRGRRRATPTQDGGGWGWGEAKRCAGGVV